MERPIRIDPFFDEDGKITKLPKKHAVRLAVLARVTALFEPGRIYSETEVNGICAGCQTFGDIFLLRRELVDHGFLTRKPDGSAYWRSPETPKEAVVPREP